MLCMLEDRSEHATGAGVGRLWRFRANRRSYVITRGSDGNVDRDGLDKLTRWRKGNKVEWFFVVADVC